jgi:hypothetical protein
MDGELVAYVRHLTFLHRQDFLERRANHWRKVLALFCFMLFVVLRLLIYSIYTANYPLLIFCLICSVGSFVVWRRDKKLHRQRDEELAANLRELVANLELFGRVTAQISPGAELNTLSPQTKASWVRFSWGTEEAKPEMSRAKSPRSVGGGTNAAKIHADAAVVDLETDLEAGTTTSSSSPTPSPPSSPREDRARTLSESINAAFSGTFASLEEQPTCSICLCEYEDADFVVRLPCNHLFHDNCIAEWVGRNVRCPLCNLDLRTVNADGSENTEYLELLRTAADQEREMRARLNGAAAVNSAMTSTATATATATTPPTTEEQVLEQV